MSFTPQEKNVNEIVLHSYSLSLSQFSSFILFWFYSRKYWQLKLNSWARIYSFFGSVRSSGCQSVRPSVCLSGTKCSRALNIHLIFNLTSCWHHEDIMMTSWCLQDVFRTSSGCLQDVFRTTSGCLQDNFRTTSGRLQEDFRKTIEIQIFVCLMKSVLPFSLRSVKGQSKVSLRSV